MMSCALGFMNCARASAKDFSLGGQSAIKLRIDIRALPRSFNGGDSDTQNHISIYPIF